MTPDRNHRADPALEARDRSVRQPGARPGAGSRRHPCSLEHATPSPPARGCWRSGSGFGGKRLIMCDGYTHGMKVAVSIPDRTFQRADRFARRVQRTRSAVYAAAVAEYLERHDPDAVTEAMNQVCDKAEPAPDDFVRAAGRRVLERTEW